MDINAEIEVAMGKKPPEMVLANASILNVFTDETRLGDVAIYKGKIVGVGDFEAKKKIDLRGKYLSPGFIDGHVHLESSMVSVPQFARAVVPVGTLTVVADPHEILAVRGVKGLKYLYGSSKNLPLDIFFTLPFSMLKELSIPSRKIVGIGEIDLGELVNILKQEKKPYQFKKLLTHKRLCGHAPGVTGNLLSAYLVGKIDSDHETNTLSEMEEKLRMGMHIMVRSIYQAKNLVQLRNSHQGTFLQRSLIATDDTDPLSLIQNGHVNYVVKKLLDEGMDPIESIRMATINVAQYYGLEGLGAIAPGYFADVLVLDGLRNLEINMVFKRGRLVAKDGVPLFQDETPALDEEILKTVKIGPVSLRHLKVLTRKDKENVIHVTEREGISIWVRPEKIRIENGYAVSDTEHDVLKLVVVDRYSGEVRIRFAFVSGFSLEEGCLASSIQHDAHNIVCLGCNDEDMLWAIRRIAELNGGLVAVGGKRSEELALPIAGLMSNRSIVCVSNKLIMLNRMAHELGTKFKKPFHVLSFLSIPLNSPNRKSVSSKDSISRESRI